MKNIVRSSDPDDSLKAAREALAQTEERIRVLETERTEKLSIAEGDYLAEVDEIDRQLVTLRANAVVHTDRIAAMKTKRVAKRRTRREQEKTSAIAEIKKRREQLLAVAGKLDEAVKNVADVFAELIAADEAVFKGWTDVLPKAHTLTYTRATVLDALSTRRVHRMTSGAVRQLVERVPFNFAVAIDEKSGELIAELEAAPIPEPPKVNDNVESAA